MENSKMQDYKNSSCSINSTTIKPRTGRVLICKNSMRLRWDPPLEIQVLTVLRNYEKKHQKTQVRKGHQLLHFRFGTENIYKIVFCQKFKSGTVGTIERYSNLKITPLFL